MNKISKILVCLVLVVALTLSMAACVQTPITEVSPSPSPIVTSPSAKPTPTETVAPTKTPGGGGGGITFPDGWDKPQAPSSVTPDGIGGLVGNGTYTMKDVAAGSTIDVTNEAFTGKLIIANTEAIDSLKINMPYATVEIQGEVGTLEATTGQNTLIFGSKAKITTSVTVKGGNVEALKDAVLKALTIATGNTTTQTVNITNAKVETLTLDAPVSVKMTNSEVPAVTISVPSKVIIETPTKPIAVTNNAATANSATTEIAIIGSPKGITVENSSTANIAIDVSKQDTVTAAEDKLTVTDKNATDKVTIIAKDAAEAEEKSGLGAGEIDAVTNALPATFVVVTEDIAAYPTGSSFAFGFKLTSVAVDDFKAIAEIKVELLAGAKVVATNTMTPAGLAYIISKNATEVKVSSPFYPVAKTDANWNFGSTLITKEEVVTSAKITVTDKAGNSFNATGNSSTTAEQYKGIFAKISIDKDFIASTAPVEYSEQKIGDHTYSRISVSIVTKESIKNTDCIQSMTFTLNFANGKTLTHVAKLSEWTKDNNKYVEAFFYATDGINDEVKTDRTWWTSAAKIDTTFGDPKSITLKVTDKLGQSVEKTSPTISAAVLTQYKEGIKKIEVTTPAGLTAALADPIYTNINLNGTFGSASDATSTDYTIDRKLSLTGATDAKVFGSFVVIAEGVEFDGIAIESGYKPLNNDSPAKNGINAYVDSLTVTNCSFTAGASGDDPNGIVIFPKTIGKQNYEIKRNLFTDYNKSNSPVYLQAGIFIAEDYPMSHKPFFKSTAKSAKFNGDNFQIAMNNTYTNCDYEYLLQNGFNLEKLGTDFNQTVVYAQVGTIEGLNNAVEYSRERTPSTIVVSTIVVNEEEVTLTKNLTIGKDTYFQNFAKITIPTGITLTNNGVIRNSITIDSEDDVIPGEITNNGTITNNGKIDNIGIITNKSGAMLTNVLGGVIFNGGTTVDGTPIVGTIINAGTIDNTSGTIINAGTIDNTSGTIDNTSGTIINAGTIDNTSGTIYGTVTNEGDGKVTGNEPTTKPEPEV